MQPGDRLPTGHRLVRRVTGGDRWLVVHPDLPGRSWLLVPRMRRDAGPEDDHPLMVRAEPLDPAPRGQGGPVPARLGGLVPLDGARLVAELVAPMEPDEHRWFDRALAHVEALGRADLSAEALLWDGRALTLLPAEWPALGGIEDLDAVSGRFLPPWLDAGPPARGRPRVGAVTSAGLARAHNEDSFVLAGREDALFVAVIDAIGGFGGGTAAARGVGAAVTEAFERQPWGPGAAATVMHFLGAHAAQPLVGKTDGGGASLIAAVVEHGRVEIGHIGNCRGYHWKGGAPERLTREHTLVERMVQEGKITPEQAGTHRHRNILLRSISGDADAEMLRADRASVTLRPGERLVLCTDGLYDTVDDRTIARLLARAHTPRQAAALLHGAAIDAGAPDNVAVAVVEG